LKQPLGAALNGRLALIKNLLDSAVNDVSARLDDLCKAVVKEYEKLDIETEEEDTEGGEEARGTRGQKRTTEGKEDTEGREERRRGGER
jgi:hypothetical protein